MNPTSNQNPMPNQQSPVASAKPLPTNNGNHIVLTVVLILVILLTFGFLGWKWFSTNQNMAGNDLSQISNTEMAGDDQSSESVTTSDALDGDMSVILNSSSESDLKAIDDEF